MNVASDVCFVRVFVSSPIDVTPERGRVQAIAAKLNREYDGLVAFETVLWEEHFYKADKSFQPQIPESVACDIVVSIFWTRIGTEQPPDFPRMPDGRPYPSGTAYELLTALEASKSKGVPDVYVFRKTADAPMSTADAERRRQAQTQLDALEAFWNEWFKAEKGQFKAAFQTFPSTDAFEQQLEQLLRQWLETHGVLGPRLAWPKEKGSPFRGLAPFEAKHAAVFFGRDRVIDEARRRLNAAAERGTPFLLIVGASGAGKSSLARAGLIPRMTTPGMVASVDVWRVARMKPSEGQAGPLMALATALFATDALPELTQGDYPNPAALDDNLTRGGEASAQPLARALARVAEETQHERHTDQALKPALVLLVDQFEELFAQGVSDADRAAFAESIKQLVTTGRVWCVATLRADLYELLLKQPVLKALKEAGASLDLGPPGPAELAEIVRAPAEAAGLVFDRDADKGELDEQLLTDAKTADSLPLLQFTLRQLYDRRVEADGKVKLTHAAYNALGGLEGAIAAEAERAVAKLPPTSLDALPRLLRRLAEPARDGKTLTLREVPRTDASADTGEAALVDALLGARILIARTDAEQRPTVRLAHDAVLASWPRAKEAAQASRDFYRVRAEVEDALRRWEAHDRPKDRLIQTGVPLAEAEKLIENFGRELPADFTGYVTASRHRARARQRLVAAAAVFFFALTIAATGAGIMAYRAQREAVRAEQQAVHERDRATEAEARADGELQKALLRHAQFLTNVALQQADQSDFTVAALLGLEALPVWAPAEIALFRGMSNLRELTILGHQKPVNTSSFSPDGSRIVTGSADGIAREWDAATGTQLLELRGHQGGIQMAVFSPDGTKIVTASSDMTARLWDATSGQALIIFRGHSNALRSVAFSADGRQIVTSSGAPYQKDATARVWDVATGKQIAVTRDYGQTVDSAVFSPDGSRILTSSTDGFARLWDATTGTEIAAIRGHGMLQSAVFSPDGGQVLTASADNTASLWDAGSGKELLIFRGHENTIQTAKFNPAGTLVVTASWDGTARIWDSVSGRELVTLAGHEEKLYSAAFSPDGMRIVTASEDNSARIWDARIGRKLDVIRGHGWVVTSASFSPDGNRIVTASWDRTARVWNASTGAEMLVLRGDNPSMVLSAAFSPDGTRVVTSYWRTGVAAQVWDASTGRPLTQLQGDQGFITTAAFSPDGKRIVTACADGTARIWDANSGKELVVFSGQRGQYLAFSSAFSPDGTRVVTAFGDNTARVWDANSGHELLAMHGHSDSVVSAAFSPDGTRVVTASGDKTARVWDASSGHELLVMRGHETGLFFAGFSPNGSRIVTTAADGTVRLWDAIRGHEVAVLRGPKEIVRAAGFSPDGTRLVTASSDGTARFWHIFRTTKELVDYAKLHLPRCLSPTNREKFLLDPDPRAERDPLYCKR